MVRKIIQWVPIDGTRWRNEFVNGHENHRVGLHQDVAHRGVVPTLRAIGSGPSSEGICSENESLDTEEIAVRIVLRSAAFAPTGPHGRFAGDKGTYQYLDLSRFSVLAYRYQHDHALAMGVQGKELDHVIVVKRQTSGTQALGVSGEIHFATQDASLELHCAVSAITEAPQDDLQVCQEEDVHGRLGWQLLVQPQMTRLSAEVSCLQAFEHMAVTVVYVGPSTAFTIK